MSRLWWPHGWRAFGVFVLINCAASPITAVWYDHAPMADRLREVLLVLLGCALLSRMVGLAYFSIAKRF